MKTVIRRYELTDAERDRLQEYFPDRQAGDKGRPRKDSRQILNGILWIARSGAAWRDLPERYGAWQPSINAWFSGRKQGFWSKFSMISARTQICRISASTAPISRLTRRAREPQKRGMRSQNQRQNECIGVSRGGRSTKIHAVVDALGNPIHVQLSAWNVHDVMVAEELLHPTLISGSAVLADKAYRASRLREYITEHQVDYYIPPKSNESEPWFCD